MSKLIILGATGSLGKHVAVEALRAGHQVTAAVRNPSKLPPEVASRVTVSVVDIAAASTAELATAIRGHEALISTAGAVGDGEKFVALFDRIVTAVESIEAEARPVCWFLAGAAMLALGETTQRGIDLPVVPKTYWPHRENFERLQRSSLNWRLLCPGPMVEGPALGLDKLRQSVDRLPVSIPLAKALPGFLLLPLFAYRIPEMIVPYADAAALMVANLAPDSALARNRVGLALPLGMRGSKKTWTAAAKQ